MLEATIIGATVIICILGLCAAVWSWRRTRALHKMTIYGHSTVTVCGVPADWKGTDEEFYKRLQAMRKPFIPAGTLTINFEDGDEMTVRTPDNPSREDISKAIQAEFNRRIGEEP